MAQLAIKGHATRGKEVIEILEMFGGKNDNSCYGGFINRIYFINENGYIESCDRMHHLDYLQLTVEEFLGSFPYKVGDKVQHKGATSCGTVYVIEHMKWANNHTEYEIRPLYDYNHTGLVIVTAEDLQPFKEETMDNAVFDANAQCCDIMNHLIKKETIEGKITKNEDEGTLVAIDLTREIKKANEIEVILGDYEFVLKDGKTYFIKKLKYPKTYEECCKVLNISYPYFKTEEDGVSASTYKNKLFGALKQLIICRDAYWKIAGDWKFDFDSEMYYLCNEYGEIQKFKGNVDCNVILAFPTEEMRDAFFENFKDLIDLCKELL